MNESLWCLIFACIFILYLCDRWAKRRIEMWVRRRRYFSSNNVVVLPISSGHALPSSAASIPNFSLPQQPAESVQEDNYEILIFTEGSESENPSINEENDCAICLSEYLKGEHYGVLPACTHKFHDDCIMIWLVRSVNKTCPICRTQV